MTYISRRREYSTNQASKIPRNQNTRQSGKRTGIVKSELEYGNYCKTHASDYKDCLFSMKSVSAKFQKHNIQKFQHGIVQTLHVSFNIICKSTEYCMKGKYVQQ